MNEAKQDRAPGWWGRLSAGLRRTSSAIGGAISDLVSRRRLDAVTIEELEEVLIRADLGVATAARIAAALREGRHDKAITPDEVKGILAAEVEKVLAPVAKPLAIAGAKPFVILVAGVNGSGKTTTIGKLAAKYRAEGRSVFLAAGDTFRAAAEHARPYGRSGKGRARDQEDRPAGASCGAAGARRHGGPERVVAGRGIFQDRWRDRARHDQARRHRARRHPGGHRGKIPAAGAFHRRRRRDRRPRAVPGARLRPRHRRPGELSKSP